MDVDLIERLMRMLEASALDTLEVTEGNLHVRLSKSGSGRTVATEPAADADVVADSGLHRIVAGLSGTFYHAPSPEAEPFVKLGDAVTEGQVLGLVEAMKMLNPVEADCAGVVAAIVTGNGQSVAPGQVLIELRKA